MTSDEEKTYTVIFAGGTGSRMVGARKPKQFLELGGRPIIVHTLEVFEQSPDVCSIVVACIEGWISELEDLVKRFGLSKVKKIVPGGVSGQDSIFNGLSALRSLPTPPCNEDVVLIHDGVRPLITCKTIASCIQSVRMYGCTAVTAPVTETIIVDEDTSANRVLDRSRCRLARAPQGFRFGELWSAHLRARKENFHESIDSASLMSRYGYSIHSVEGPEENIKITTPRDFFAFKSFVDMKEVAQIWEP